LISLATLAARAALVALAGAAELPCREMNVTARQATATAASIDILSLTAFFLSFACFLGLACRDAARIALLSAKLRVYPASRIELWSAGDGWHEKRLSSGNLLESGPQRTETWK
jgi:hypothetical protein